MFRSIKSLQNQKGFTLLELVVVVAIVAVLALGIAPVAVSQIEKSRVSTVLSDIRGMQTGVSMYYADMGDYPADVGSLVDSESAGWEGPYVDRAISKNPFGGDYEYSKVDAYMTDGVGLEGSGDGALGDWNVSDPILIISFNVGEGDITGHSGAGQILTAFGADAAEAGDDVIVINLKTGQVTAVDSDDLEEE